MTGSLRSTARNPVAIALMGVLILVFLVLGVGGTGKFPDLFHPSRADAVVVAGSHAMSARDFRRIFEQEKTRFEKQAGQTYSAEFLVQNGFDRQLLDAIGLDEAFTEMLSRAGVRPGPSLVDAEIRKLPFAFDRVTGKFSEQQFTQALAAQGLTPREAEQEITDELAQRHFTYAIAAGFAVPRAYAALNAVTGLESRDVSWFILDPRSVPRPAPPTDAQLIAFMKANAAQLTRPEMRAITLVRFSAKAFEPTVTVAPADIAKEFAFRKDSLSTPERRTVVQIPVKTAAEGATVASGLAKGEDPQALARSLGTEAITYADQPRTALPDGKLAAAAFALAPGQTKGPVQGDLGMAVLEVIKVTPGVEATLENSSAKIEADLRAKAAADKAYDLSQKFDDARQAGSSVADAARKVGVVPVTVGPLTADGRDAQGKPDPAASDKIVKSAFAHAAGEETDIEDTGAGEYFALRVEKVIPPSLPALDEVRPQLTRAYMTQAFLTALKARAEGLMGEMRKGETIAQAAAKVGAHVTRQAGMQRIAAQQYKAMGRDFLEGVFTSKPGEVFAATAANGVFVAKLDAVRPPDPLAAARVIETIRGRLGESYVGDVMNAVKTASRQAIKVTVNLNVARQAIGVDPALLRKAGAKPAAPAK
ncbi:MAG: SurA N-terminal domain-containing protein [Caulobacteraceae bacterium]